MVWPVRNCIRTLIPNGNPPAGCNPSLWLDKYVEVGDEKVKKTELEKFIELFSRSGQAYNAAYQRWKQAFGDQQPLSFQTAGPMALHLARAGSLENAGICLHRLYGFPYIPGSGVKGLAHAWACTVWFPARCKEAQSEDEKKAAWKQIVEVFGSAPSPWLDDPGGQDNAGGLLQWIEETTGFDPAREEGRKRKDVVKDWTRSGQVVFHDAWPARWPQLDIDILNCHHRDYYGAKEGMVPPPGDWEDPVPVYFPIVKKGQSFDFYVTPRTPGTSAGVLEQAREWLKGGLAHLGAGGKTNSGYGVFSIGEDVAPALISTNHLRTWETTVKLVTPAFLAGPRQDGSDCDLRPATLRGLLRWWWRTLHAKHMSPQILRELESILWGNSEQGGAIAINLAACDNNPRPIPSPFKGMVSTQHGQRLAVNEIFTNRHRIVLDNNRSCGLAYLAYGMDEYFSQENRRHQRWCIVPKAGWTLSFITKNTCYRGTILGAETILAQAKAALCLLLRYGGVGSRSRRGFGSLALPSELIPWQHTKIRDIGIELRKFANIQNHNQAIATPAFDDLLLGEKLLNITDPWLALNHVGNAYMHFATSQKHQRTKMGLGLPRKIHGPNKTPIKGRQNPQTHKSPELLISLKASGANARHPAALFFSFDYTDNQNILVRISAMPDPWLISPGVQTQPERDTHRRYLLNVINHIFQHI